ncbi:tetratricopeptide repeat protein [Brevundimonas sp.]|uniref:tetratricopeptide repeat protein n=1 Tax=Brevundimonas sp. TaxID=1871086 RepID=UPI002C94B479|nr:tetratricopeptide repeat protein [Brevundimonas sp.]HWQ86317.1 tetratricopeptide repeat protein [Brevundimonas sp.]
MRPFRLASLLTGCAALALCAPALAQDAPTVTDPPVVSPAGQSPIVVPIPEGEAVAPDEVPAEEPPVEPAEPAAAPIPAIWAPVPVDAAGQSAYGLYLAGRLASIRGDRAAGSEFLTEAHALAPEQPLLGEEAFRSGLFSGDIGVVARLTPTVADTPQLAEVGRLIEVVEGLRAGNPRQSLALLTAGPFEMLRPAARYLTPAVAAAADDWETALKVVDAPPADPAGLVLHQQRAGLLESRRRFAEADAEYRILMAAPGGAMLYALDYAEFLERQGRRDEALAIYDGALSGGNPESRAAIARARVIGRGRPPAAPDMLEHASDALVFAALQTSASENHEVSAIYLRLADSLHPDDLTVLQLGQSLSNGRQPLLAQEVFSRVGKADPITYARAQVGLAVALGAQGDDAAALEAFRRADAAALDQAAFAYALAAHLQGMGRHEEALAILNRPTINVAAQPPQFRFLRGAALENLGRIDEAEAELWAALQAQPNDPTILNYLGYLWVDSGRRVAEGAEMLARAHAADPQNGNIQDSLGWAQFRQGQYETAVQTLEEAVGKQPGNAEIVDHLGDAYWQVGRRREAEWQWSRVLTLEPDAPRRAEVEQKLVRGLPDPATSPGGQP